MTKRLSALFERSRRLADERSIGRREVVILGATAGSSLLGTALLSEGARADVAAGPLDVSGNDVTTDNGQLQTLTVTLDSGHLSYDGLDTTAATVDVNLYGGPTGGDTAATGNQIASTGFTVADESTLDTHAGSVDFTFDSVDVLAAQDVKKNDFHATTDGETKETDVEFRLEVVVKDGTGTTVVEGDDVSTATISVTNQPRSTGVQGSGATNAGGSNQKP